MLFFCLNAHRLYDKTVGGNLHLTLEWPFFPFFDWTNVFLLYLRCLDISTKRWKTLCKYDISLFFVQIAGNTFHRDDETTHAQKIASYIVYDKAISC